MKINKKVSSNEAAEGNLMTTLVHIRREPATDAQHLFGWKYNEWQADQFSEWCAHNCKGRYAFRATDEAVLTVMFEQEADAHQFDGLFGSEE